MMKVLVLLLNLLCITNLQLLQPHDLIQEAEAQLEQLRTLVEMDSLAAFDDLYDMATDFEDYSDNLYIEASISLQQEKQTLDSLLNTVKELGQSSGKDVSPCTNDQEDLLEELPKYYNSEIGNCFTNVKTEVGTVMSSSRYVIDVTINKVHDLENQYQKCGANLLCIEPLIQEVRLYKGILPQNIKKQLESTQDIMNNLELLAQDCVSQNMSEYVLKASSIIDDITDCVNNLVNK